MATYKFDWVNGGAEIVNPSVTIDGDVGTKVINGVPSDSAYADIILTTVDGSKYGVRLEDETKPIDWTIENLEIWVGQQLQKYIV